jgi:arylsulfatase A-like enzyme
VRSSEWISGLGPLAVACCTLACAPSGPAGSESPDAAGEPEPRPDIVLIVIDTLRRDFLDLYGHHSAAGPTAPFLAELAGRAAVFERGHSTSSWTAPATASVFTGLYPNEHGVVVGFRARNNALQEAEAGATERMQLVALPHAWRTLPELLAAAGYATFGIATNINIGSQLGFDRGFERFEQAYRARAEEVVATALGWRAELAGERPYFLYLHFNDVHQPYEGRPEFGYRPADEPLADSIAAYESEIRYLDHWLGVLFAEMGWTDEGSPPAALMLVSDHGEEFMDHGSLGHRYTLHAEVNDVVMLLAASGVRGGTRLDQPASLVDVAPTLLAAAGIAPPAGTSGRSLLALARDPRQAAAARSLFAHRVRGSPSEPIAARRPLWAAIDGPWKLVHNEERASYALFDVGADPRETRDLAAARPDVVERLRAELEAFRGAAVLREGAGVEVLLDQELLRELEALGYAGHD